MQRRSLAAILVSLSLLSPAGCRKTGRPGRSIDVGRLTSQLKHTDSGKRTEAAYMLGQAGAEAKAAIPALAEALRDTDDGVRSQAAQSLGRIGSEAATAMPALLLALQKDANGSTRGYAAWALGQLGPGAKAAVPSLMEALADKDAAESAADALHALGEGESAAKRLAEIVNDAKADPRTRAGAVMGFKKTGDRKAAVAFLVSIIEDKSAVPEVRRTAALAVGHMGYERIEEAKGAVPALLRNLDQKDVCHSGPWSLWALGATEQAVARLIELLAHKDPELRAKAASGLVHMAGGNPPKEAKAAVPALIRALKQKDDARPAVISALGEIGPDAKEAVPALMALLKDDDQWTRDRANDAIKKIAP